MPRVSVLRFTKGYEEVAEAFKSMVKSPVVTERVEDDHPVVEIEGDFEHFVLEDMETWGGYFKFEVKDFQIKDASDREARAILSEGIPGYGAVLFSPTIAFVYRRVRFRIDTHIVTLRIEEDERRSEMDRKIEEGEWQEEWKDITHEFGKKVHINR